MCIYPLKYRQTDRQTQFHMLDKHDHVQPCAATYICCMKWSFEGYSKEGENGSKGVKQTAADIGVTLGQEDRKRHRSSGKPVAHICLLLFLD